MTRLLALLSLVAVLVAASPALAVYSCGGVNDDCQCGMDNPYPCCNNGNGKSSNCTWGAWHHACCGWGKGLPGWSHAKYWAGNANAHPDYEVHGSPKVSSIGCKDTGTYGHVAWVTAVNGGSVTVHEQSCCEGSSCWPNCSWCINGYATTGYQASYYSGGYITPKGAVGPFCGDGSCNNGENCSSCEKDCGKCEYCGDGKCNNGESCSSCSKDCGACCGNGQCDNGESCASCEKDCGICNEVPKGELEVVNCQVISGWALDGDVNGAIDVRLKVDGNVLQQLPANGPHGKHDGHGFVYNPGHDLKDSNAHVIEVIALDDKGLADSAIPGSGKQLYCRNGVELKSIWTVSYADAAGIDITPVPGEGGWAALQLLHPGSLPWANSGLVTAYADIAATPFEKITADLCGTLPTNLYQATFAVDGDAGGPLLGDGPCVPKALDVAGSRLGLSLAALGFDVDTAPRELRLENLAFWSRGWRFGYAADAAGLLFANDAVDRVTFAARENVEACTGFVAAQRTFATPFQGVTLAAETPAPGEPALTLKVGDGEPVPLGDCLVAGNCTVDGVDADRLEVRAECGAGTGFAPGWKRTVDGLRVYRTFAEDFPPWHVAGERVWGLAGDLPDILSEGLSFRLSTLASDFVPFGSVLAQSEWAAPPIEEVRGMLSYSLPGKCYQAFLTIDGAPVQSCSFGQEQQPFTLVRTGSSFGIAIAAQGGCTLDQPDAFFQVDNVSVKRGGWWTTPSATFAGIRDTRTEEGCGILFENQKWWGMSENKAHGTLLVHRYLEDEYTGIRYRVRHTFEGPFFRFRASLGGKPVKEHTLQKPSEWEEEVTGKSFSEVGFTFAVATKDVYPYKWQLSVEEIELFRPGVGWVSACEAQEAEPELEGIQETGGEDLVALPDGGDEGDHDKAGCAAGRSSAGSWLPLLALLLVLVAVGRREEVR
jgi:surface antigen